MTAIPPQRCGGPIEAPGNFPNFAALWTTNDIDFPIDSSKENVARVKRALRVLKDRAVDEVRQEDVERYVVVRVADEVVVDLMARACGTSAGRTTRVKRSPRISRSRTGASGVRPARRRTDSSPLITGNPLIILITAFPPCIPPRDSRRIGWRAP